MKPMIKIIVIQAIIMALTVASIGASEGQCDGPVLSPGSSSDTCHCSNTPPNCSGSSTVRNDYYHCGGSGYWSCMEQSEVVGYSNRPCVETADTWALFIAQSAYDDCMRDQARNHPVPIPCIPPRYCDWHTCTAGTSGGQPIVRQVEWWLGFYWGCEK